jgi:hypothetical protein
MVRERKLNNTLSDFFLTSRTAGRLTFFALCSFLLLLAYRNRFIQDDAFISFRYASNFFHGHGLLWNIAEKPVEGYTNFLWTLLMSIAFSLNADPVIFSQITGLICFLGTIFFTYRLSFFIMHSTFYAMLVILVLGTNYTFSAYATGGLETQLQTFLFICITYLTLTIAKSKNWQFVNLLLLSFVSALALLTRLDSSLPIAVLFLYLGFLILQDSHSIKFIISRFFTLVLPCAVIVGTWIGWKLWFYGTILPNTFHAKIGSPTSFMNGIGYIISFFESYWLIIFPLLSVLLCKKNDFLQSQLSVIMIVILLWCAYIVKTGGDFMEFRFLVPVLPFIFLCIIYGIRLLDIHEFKIMFIILMILIGSIWHQFMFQGWQGIESINDLYGHLKNYNEDWDGIGRTLGKLFPSDNDIVIATTAAGAIPFYSNLKTIDMLGLNDEWVARHGKFLGNRPGHQRIADLPYLIKSGVNLVIGHPQMKPINRKTARKVWFTKELKRFLRTKFNPELIPADATVLEIPINNKYNLLVLYLLKHELIEQVIKEKQIKTYKIVLQA